MDPGLLEAMHRVERSHWWFRARRDLLLAVVADRIPPGARLLDVGSGTGFFLEAAAVRYRVQGLDASPEAVAYCRARGLDSVRQAGVAALAELQRGSFDAVCFFDVLEHLDDDTGGLRLARRLLARQGEGEGEGGGGGRRGGAVILTVPAFPWLWSPHDEANHHRRRYTRGSLRAALEAAELVPEFVSYFNSYLFPLAVPARLLARATRRGGSAQVRPPPPVVNRAFERVFRAEERRLVGPARRAFAAGLSLLAIAGRGPEAGLR